MQTLSSIRQRGWSGRIASLPLSFLTPQPDPLNPLTLSL